MNFKRKHFLSLVDRIQFDLLSYVAAENAGEMIVANQESLSPQQERVEDLMAIVQSFSGWLCGMRKYHKTIKEDFSEYKLATVKDKAQ